MYLLEVWCGTRLELGVGRCVLCGCVSSVMDKGWGSVCFGIKAGGRGGEMCVVC